jgi:hypothetical protein
MYLLYTTEEEAWNRSEQEGIALGLAYHKVGSGSRYVTRPMLTADDQYALEVSTYNLTEDEESSTVSEVTFPTEEI